MDLIVPIGAAGAMFAERHHERLFPDTPILFTAASPRLFSQEFPSTNAALVTQRINLTNMVEDVLLMQPATTNIVVVFGATQLERIWIEECRREFAAYTNRVSFTWVDELPLPQILERCAELPPDPSFCMPFSSWMRPGCAAKRTRPCNVCTRSPMRPYSHILAANLVWGASAAGCIRTWRSGRRPPASQLGFWEGIGRNRSRLSSWGSRPRSTTGGSSSAGRSGNTACPRAVSVHFREPGFLPPILAAHGADGRISFAAKRTDTGPGVNRKTRIRAESAARDLSGRLINAHEEERSRLARDLHDDVTQRLARLAIDAGRLSLDTLGVQPTETVLSIQEGLVTLSEDVHALSYQLHPSMLEDLGLGEALKSEAARFEQQESIAMHLHLEGLPDSIPPEISLGLYRISQEALRNVARHARARRVEVTVRPLDDGLELAVCDDGSGFDPSQQRHHLSLGLASMQERVLLLGGKFDIESIPGQGTTVIAWVPLKREST